MRLGESAGLVKQDLIGLETDQPFVRCQSQSNKGPNTRGKKGPLHLVVCSALAGVLVI
jgi:hypothetical protein